MSELVLGLDLGGTQIRTVLADASGKALARRSACCATGAPVPAISAMP